MILEQILSELRQSTLIGFRRRRVASMSKMPAQATIDSANSADAASSAIRADCAASTAKNTAPIAATPAALAICAVVPYIPAPEPALAGFTVESTALDNGAITSPCP